MATETEKSACFDLADGSKPDLRSAVYSDSCEHLQCPICRQPFILPMTTVCGHTFCEECIHECIHSQQGLEDEGHCPLDRTPLRLLDVNDLFPTPLIIANMIDDLKVLCLNKGRGCTWTGRRWELEGHVTSDCGYTRVKCGGLKDEQICEELVERRFLDGNECVHVDVPCEFCGAEVPKVEMLAHLENDCPDNLVTCDLCNNDTIPKKHLEKHKKNCLLAGKFVCPAALLGCLWVGVSEPLLDNHLQSCVLSQLRPTMDSMNDKLVQLQDDNAYLRKAMNKVLDSVLSGKLTNVGYSEPLEEIRHDNEVSTLRREIDVLKAELHGRPAPSGEHDGVLHTLVNENFMLKDELYLQRALLTSLRKQVQFLMFQSRQPLRTYYDSDDQLTPSRSSSEERLNLKL